MDKKRKRVYIHLCATCAQKMLVLYRMRETPAEYVRGGMGKCNICDFRGALTEYSYDPKTDHRTPEEQAEIRAAQAAAIAPRLRRTEAEREDAKDYGFTRETFARLADAADKL